MYILDMLIHSILNECLDFTVFALLLGYLGVENLGHEFYICSILVEISIVFQVLYHFIIYALTTVVLVVGSSSCSTSKITLGITMFFFLF